MIQPAPTTKIDPELARGTLLATHAAHGEEPATIEIGFANTSYRMRLVPTGEVRAKVGGKVVGSIRAEARRVDVVRSGGRYVEPVLGRPRRVQGTIIAADNAANTITVNAGFAIVCKLTDRRQRAVGFEPGQFVSFDVMAGATFTEKLA
jgi:hypothetical protein